MIASRGSSTTPVQDAFYLPADDCRHARIWLPWPDAPALQQAIVALTEMITPFEPVAIVAAPKAVRDAQARCGKVEVVALEHTSLRLRDTGPTFLVDGKGGAAAVDWRFSVWGGRGAYNTADRQFAHALLGTAEVRRFRAPLSLEASAFVTDGEGTLLALAPAVFDPNRNPALTRLEAFAIFQHWLGATRVIWLEEPSAGDALCTDVRALAAFAAPGKVLVSAGAGNARETLGKARDAQGKNLELIALPAPVNAPGQSYTQFLCVNAAVLAPMFGEACDAAAHDIIAGVFPNRALCPVPMAPFIAAGISLASLAVTQPARLLQRDRATVLPRSAWAQPAPDINGLLQKYIDLARER